LKITNYYAVGASDLRGPEGSESEQMGWGSHSGGGGSH
jgi:hypothetical protein